MSTSYEEIEFQSAAATLRGRLYRAPKSPTPKASRTPATTSSHTTTATSEQVTANHDSDLTNGLKFAAIATPSATHLPSPVWKQNKLLSGEKAWEAPTFNTSQRSTHESQRS